MTIKLIAIDIDGTLLNDDKKWTEKGKEAIHAAKKAGIQVVLCTGRPFPGVTDYLKELEFTHEDDYVITYNGALVQKVASEEILAEYTMTHEDYLVLQEAASTAGTHFHAIINEGIFTPNKDISMYSVRESFLINIPLFYREPKEMDPSTHYNKMMMIDHPSVLEEAISRLPKHLWDDYTVLRSEPFFLEFVNKQASKGMAVKALAERLGYSSSEVMAIGDGGNDVDMVDYAGIGIAMENATDDVKAVSDIVTKSNNEDGVAHAIFTYALNQNR